LLALAFGGMTVNNSVTAANVVSFAWKATPHVVGELMAAWSEQARLLTFAVMIGTPLAATPSTGLWASTLVVR
jgi:hypothetical protein